MKPRRVAGAAELRRRLRVGMLLAAGNEAYLTLSELEIVFAVSRRALLPLLAGLPHLPIGRRCLYRYGDVVAAAKGGPVVEPSPTRGKRLEREDLG
jgi:hypothetical protein